MLNEKVNNLQLFAKVLIIFVAINPFALRKAKIAYNFGLSECNRVKLVGSLVQKYKRDIVVTLASISLSVFALASK